MDGVGKMALVHEHNCSRRLSGLKVLVADDCLDNQLLVEIILRLEGAEVLPALNGRQAVEIAEREDVDVVLMDIQMPVMDGVEATMALRGHGFNRPIIAFTAYNLNDWQNSTTT